jgi:hypothetical protein
MFNGKRLLAAGRRFFFVQRKTTTCLDRLSCKRQLHNDIGQRITEQVGQLQVKAFE